MSSFDEETLNKQTICRTDNVDGNTNQLTEHITKVADNKISEISCQSVSDKDSRPAEEKVSQL
jgi:hypothetical protein